MIAKYENVELCQDERPVLTDINLEINEAEFIYILGEVGSGKTSLLKSLYGELGIAKGQATVLDFDMNRMKPRKLPKLRRQLGIVFQDFQLLRDRTVDANLNFVLRATGWSKKTDREARIIEVLEQVGLPDKTRHMPYELSGGEQQRVCIARALLNKPRLLLADEPTANLDADNGAKVMELLNSIREQGTTIVMSTHNELWPHRFPGIVWRCREGKVVVESSEAPDLLTRAPQDEAQDAAEEPIEVKPEKSEA
ncbi:MAG: ATP-binding cassette domain-containing protein [Bacteroidaceae bacterium]|nr:ATP-binding cassette domain-containing protein [Bacteroidaceae bacterium]MBR1788120.1 ATP-binding cassette domain-containing protein [Bacteroidaceae bacterium]